MSSFYAIAVGNKTGVFTSWDECKIHIKDFENPVYKKFENIEDATKFVDDYNNNLYVYTDGACINNGQPNARASIGVYFNKDNPNNISLELTNHNKPLTNNIAELTAVIEAIKLIKDNEKPNKIIVTDSEYVIKCVTTYGKKLSDIDWKPDKKVPNLSLVKSAYELSKKYKIQFKHVLAHTDNKDKHSIGNYYADLLASKALNIEKNKKIYLNVAFKDKEDAKKYGAKWDAQKKKWYSYEDNKDITYLLSKYKD